MLGSIASSDVAEEIDAVLYGSSDQKRLEVLRGVTELFVGASVYSEMNESLFDEVMNRLIDHAGPEALAELSRSLAPYPHAPPRTVARLAGMDDIAVAGPVLERCERLNDAALMEIARNKGQSHLSSIARRPHIPACVTEILARCGDRDVAHLVLANVGAELSPAAVAKLAALAEGDRRLAAALAGRSAFWAACDAAAE